MRRVAYSPSWELADEFFGAGVYRISVRVIDRNGSRSPSESVKFETTD